MDSIVGSIYLAFLLSQQGDDNVVVPLINFPIADLPLRNDVMKLFSQENIDINLLRSAVADGSDAFVDIKANVTDLTLFDHNKLNPQQTSFASLVRRVVDHHKDENLPYKATSDLYEVSEVGSASTLVEELYFARRVPVPQPLLLLSPILLDTMNFDPAHKKVTQRDVASRDRLVTQIPSLQSPESLTQLFIQLNDWKCDTTSLTPQESLRRDYKKFEFESPVGVHHIGISSVPLLAASIDKLYGHETWLGELTAYRESHGLDALAVMFAANVGDTFVREFSILCKPQISEIISTFATSTDDSIGLELASSHAAGDELVYQFYHQRDGAVSRKKLTPLLAEHFSRL